MVCVCGADCGKCPQYKKECEGCAELHGKVYWVAYIGKEVCPCYACAAGRNIKNCGECEEIPCDLWYSLKDPGWTEEQHLASIAERLARFGKSCGKREA